MTPRNRLWGNAREGRILVIAAHGDDEVLGAGGALADAARVGFGVKVVILSVASDSRDLDPETRLRFKDERIAAARAAAAIGGWSLDLHDFPDNRFCTVPRIDLVKVIERTVAETSPTMVMTHFPGDLSRDHQITAAATRTAVRPDGLTLPADLVFFEVQSSTEWCEQAIGNSFCPTLWYPLTDEAWQAKIRALACYESELRRWPHPRSQEGVDVLARYRGSQIGVPLAEAFMLARGVTRFAGAGSCSD